MRKFKLIILFCLVALFLIACSKTTNKVNESLNKDEVHLPVSNSSQVTETAKDQPAKDQPLKKEPLKKEPLKKEPEYIDESLYEGDDLEFVKLINLSVQYINSEDETAYKGLLSSDTGIGTMPNRKVQKVELLGIGDVTETQAAVRTNWWMDENDTSEFGIYVFRKEQNVWRIYDID
ncbi:MAG: hypothetical protein WDZ91_08485 [Paenibacillaceae bacterium]